MSGVFEEQKGQEACDLKGHRELTLVVPCLLLLVRGEALGKLGAASYMSSGMGLTGFLRLLI